MIKLLCLIIFLIVFESIVFGQKFCQNGDPLETIFTLDNVSYARKQDLFYRTYIGQTLYNADETYYENLFQGPGQDVKFILVQTGFMVTKVPVCDQGNPNCADVTKLKGLGFVLGAAKSTYSHDVYKTYKFEQITGRFPTLIVISDISKMPFNCKTEGQISGDFWPKNASNSVKYMYSTYDERTFTIIHIVSESGNLVLYSYGLSALKHVPEFVSHQMKSNNIKGFFHMPWPTDTDPNTIHAIRLIGVTQEDILDFSESFAFSDSSMALNDIYGCDVVTVSMKTETTVVSSSTAKLSESTESSHTVPNIPTIVDTEQTASPKSESIPSPDQEQKTSSTYLLILIGIAVIGVILIIGVIIGVNYIRHKYYSEDNQIIQKYQ